MKTVVIYHRADFDGLFCREIARKALGDEAQYIGWDYGDPEPEVDLDATLYMLDISVPNLMHRIGLIWIDHHASAIEKYGEHIGVQIDGVSACRLAWQWFNPPKISGLMFPSKQDFIDRKVDEPLAVTLVGEHDVWDHRDPDAVLFQIGLKREPTHKIRWGELLDMERPKYVNAILVHGEIIHGYKVEQDAKTIKSSGFDLEWEGLKFLALNSAKGYNSLLFKEGIREDHDACLGFGFDGRQWTVSLYGAPGKPDVDLSEIAKRYGGGGHRQACGFQCDTLPWLDLPMEEDEGQFNISVSNDKETQSVLLDLGVRTKCASLPADIAIDLAAALVRNARISKKR